MKKPGLIILGAFVLVASVYIYLEFFTVRESEKSVWSQDPLMNEVKASYDEVVSSAIVLLLNSGIAVVNDEVVPIEPENSNHAPILVDGVVMVPLRFVVESLGGKVEWVQQGDEIAVALNGKEMSMKPGNMYMLMDETLHWLGMPVQQIDSLIYVPLRSFINAADFSVSIESGLMVISASPLAHDADKESYRESLAAGLSYHVYQNDAFIEAFATKDAAVKYAAQLESASILTQNGELIWNNHPLFQVFQAGTTIDRKETFREAVNMARWYTDSAVVYKDNRLWSSEELAEAAFIAGVPVIHQLPELPRGCEVTALAMLLQFAGVDADKMTLAEEIQKDATAYSRVDGVTHFGHLQDGFVGDMYSFSNPGLGVYYEPILDLAEQYLPERMVNLSDADFADLLYYVEAGKPVWVIINTLYDTVPEYEWFTWQTPRGELQVTYRMHSVVIDGYDQNYVYFKDSLGVTDRAELDSFIRGWEQMGRQAISYID